MVFSPLETTSSEIAGKWGLPPASTKSHCLARAGSGSFVVMRVNSKSVGASARNWQDPGAGRVSGWSSEIGEFAAIEPHGKKSQNPNPKIHKNPKIQIRRNCLFNIRMNHKGYGLQTMVGCYPILLEWILVPIGLSG